MFNIPCAECSCSLLWSPNLNIQGISCTTLYRIGECGGTITSPRGTLTSPGYPEIYSDNSDCRYTIKPSSASDDSVILINFKSFDIEFTSNCGEDGEGDYLSVYDGTDYYGDDLLYSYDGTRKERGREGPACGSGIHGTVPAFLQGTKNAMYIE